MEESCWCCLELSGLSWSGSGSAATLATLRQCLQSFGSVVEVETLPGPPASLRVLYADPLAAVAARDALGGEPAVISDLGSGSEDGERPNGIVPTPTNSESESLEDSASEGEVAPKQHATGRTAGPSSATVSLDSTPRFLNNSLALSQLDWGSFNKGQEWRRDLLLRGLPPQLCDRKRLADLLRAHSLRDLARDVRVLPRRGARSGAAVVSTTSAEAAGRLAKFFHGSQFAAGGSPIAVSFAARQSLGGGGRGQSMAGAPMHVRSSHSPMEVTLPEGVRAPPGLEEWVESSRGEMPQKIAAPGAPTRVWQ